MTTLAAVRNSNRTKRTMLTAFRKYQRDHGLSQSVAAERLFKYQNNEMYVYPTLDLI